MGYKALIFGIQWYGVNNATHGFLLYALVSRHMDSIGAIIAVLVVAIGLLAGVGVVHQSLSNTGAEQAYTESFDPGTNQTHVTLNESNRDSVYYTSTVNVTDENDSLMRPGIDYQWHESNGTLTVLDDGGLDDDTTATVEYSLRIPSEQQRNYATMLGEFMNAAYAIPLLFGFALVVAGITVLGGLS